MLSMWSQSNYYQYLGEPEYRWQLQQLHTALALYAKTESSQWETRQGLMNFTQLFSHRLLKRWIIKLAPITAILYILSGQHHPQGSDCHRRIFKSEDNAGLTQLSPVFVKLPCTISTCTSLSDRPITHHRQPHAATNGTKTTRDDIRGLVPF